MVIKIRKILSKEEENKRKKRNQLAVGLILVVLMFLSVAGYAFVGGGSENENNLNSNKVSYNSFEFYNQNDFWVLNNQNVQLIFKYNPEQTIKISPELNSLDSYYNKPLYISSSNREAELEIYKNLQNYVQRIQEACIKENGEECGDNLPIKTCGDNFIIIKEDNISNILQNGSCIIITAPEENLTMVTDEFLFNLFGIE